MHFSFKAWCVNKSSFGDFTSSLFLCQDSLSSAAKYVQKVKQSSGCFVCLVPNIWIFGNIWKVTDIFRRVFSIMWMKPQAHHQMSISPRLV